MKSKWEDQISSAISKLIPADMPERIQQGILQQPERMTVMTTQTTKSPAAKRHPLLRYTGILVAACLLLAACLAGGSYYRNHMQITSVVDIDVNPSIEISSNRSDRVVKVEAVNADGADVLDGMDLKGTDLKVAINAIIGSMVKQGYLTAGDTAGILVTVRNDDAAKAQSIRNIVVSDIAESLKSNQVNAPVINQTVTADDTAKTFAETHGISFGKALFVLNLAAKDAALDAAELAKLSLKQLVDVINENHIDIRDIVDYDADDSLFENVEEGIEDGNEQAAAVLTAAEAKAIALGHAGVSDAAFIKVELDRDDGRVLYEIDFRAKGVEYDYRIDAVTGEVVEAERESDALPTGGSVKLTAEEAKAKALTHAGVAPADARILKAEFDYDDGVPVYEVEFIADGTEYEYEIHAGTGEILSVDRESADRPVHRDTTSGKTDLPADSTSEAGSSPDSTSERPASGPADTAEPATLTAAEAEDIALAHAKVARADAVFDRTELDREDGHTVYEIEFRVGSQEYDYEIDAYSGAVLSAESEQDDD